MMARVANVNIPDSKKIVIALTYIYGIGLSQAEDICLEVGIPVGKKVKDLQDSDLASLRDFIGSNYKVEGDLRQIVSFNIKKKKDMRCYQGIRHIRSLPVRGQNTHSNARTRKGKKSVSIPGKKIPKK